MMRKNEELGLPFQNGMIKYILCFDVDGTLISGSDEIYHDIVSLIRIFSRFKNIRVCVWSGGGKDYAATWGHRLGVDEYVWRYASKLEHADIRIYGKIIAIDDIQDTALGDENFIVRNK